MATCILAIGPNCWGKGSTPAEAITNMRKNWNREPFGPYGLRRCVLWRVDETATVDDLGQIHFPKDTECICIKELGTVTIHGGY